MPQKRSKEEAISGLKHNVPFKSLSNSNSQALFYEQKTFWVTLKRTCLSVICSSVVGQLRWKGHIKKHKKFLIFLINKLDFISLRKIRNNDRTIEYIIQAADIHFG